MIAIIVGSMRKNSQSEKVANYISSQLKTVVSDNVEMIRLRDLELPFWNEENFSAYERWSQISKTLDEATAFILVTPEWDGMASPAIKNFFNYCRNQELCHKPALLVAVSSGQGGSYPIAELRMSSYKNSKITYLPDHIIVRHAEEVLNNQEVINEGDFLIRERINYSLKMLKVYNEAFLSVRQHKFLYEENFRNGM